MLCCTGRSLRLGTNSRSTIRCASRGCAVRFPGARHGGFISLAHRRDICHELPIWGMIHWNQPHPIVPDFHITYDLAAARTAAGFTARIRALSRSGRQAKPARQAERAAAARRRRRLQSAPNHSLAAAARDASAPDIDPARTLRRSLRKSFRSFRTSSNGARRHLQPRRSCKSPLPLLRPS